VTNFANGRTSLLTTLSIGIITYILFYGYFHNVAFVYGADAENILAPLFFDISRSIHRYGLLAGMYDPGQVGGLSLWNTPYFHPLYPLYFNWLGSDTSILDTMTRLRMVNLVHLAIYASGSYFLCRAVGARHWLSVVAGLSAPWFPALHSLLNWPQILASFAWIPWVIGCQLLLYRNSPPSSRIVTILGLAMSFSLLVYAQPAQNMVLAIIGSAIVWVYMAASSIRHGEQEQKRLFFQSTISLAIAGAFALLVCGNYLLSVVVYMSKAIRWLGDHGTIIDQQKMPLSALREHALHWPDIVALISYRTEHTVVIGNLYLGAPLLLCALLLRSRCKNDPVVIALLSSALCAILFCFSAFAPILQWIPIANKVRELNWWSCYAVAVMIPLGSYGLQKLLDSKENTPSTSPGRNLLPFNLFGLGLVATVALLVLDKARAVDLLIACLSFAIILACCAYRFPSKWASSLACAAIVVLSTLAPALAYPRYPLSVSLLNQQDHILARNEAKEIASRITDGNSFRFAVSTDIQNYKNVSVTLANQDLRGIRGDISPQEYDKFRLLFFPTQAVADLYGVKYEILPSSKSLPSDISIDRDVSVRTNIRALPRVFFVQGGAKIVDSPIESLLNASSLDTWSFFVAQIDLPRNFDFSSYGKGNPTLIFPDVEKDTPVDIRVSLRSGAPGLLVLNEDPAARWRARLDGKSVEPIRINGFQTAFPVATAGQHQLEIRRPTHLFE